MFHFRWIWWLRNGFIDISKIQGLTCHGYTLSKKGRKEPLILFVDKGTNLMEISTRLCSMFIFREGVKKNVNGFLPNSFYIKLIGCN